MKKEYLFGLFSLFILASIWELASALHILPTFLLPSLSQILSVFIKEIPVLLPHFLATIQEAFIGLLVSTVLALFLAFLMDYSKHAKLMMMPILVLSQTIPMMAMAPLLILWFGYGMLPKIILIILVCFFPLTMTIYQGLVQIDPDYIKLLVSFDAKPIDVIRHIKIPFMLPAFFSGFKIAISYAIVGAVIAEWLGGNYGLGVYMTRVRKSYDFDKMFAVIILISLLTLLLVYIVQRVEQYVLRYKRTHY